MRLRVPLRRISRLWLLAAVLLVVQTGAMLHAYSHDGRGRLDGTPATELCVYCKVSAQLLGAAGAPAQALLLLSLLLLVRLPMPAAVAPPAVLRLAFRSRAPPSLNCL